jgi:hypothetical protein
MENTRQLGTQEEYVAARRAAVTARDRCQAAKKALEVHRASKVPDRPRQET